jgi:hypothetical protein
MLRILTALFFATFACSVTLAQATLPPEFATCASIQKNGERLACYDQAVAYLRQPTQQQFVAPSPETSFGLQATVPQPPAAAREGGKNDEVSAITARVTEVSTERDGKKLIALDNGQTWRELSKSSFVSLNAGDEVTISRAALGSFLMAVPNGRPFRVRRVK